MPSPNDLNEVQETERHPVAVLTLLYMDGIDGITQPITGTELIERSGRWLKAIDEVRLFLASAGIPFERTDELLRAADKAFQLVLDARQEVSDCLFGDGSGLKTIEMRCRKKGERKLTRDQRQAILEQIPSLPEWLTKNAVDSDYHVALVKDVEKLKQIRISEIRREYDEKAKSLEVNEALLINRLTEMQISTYPYFDRSLESQNPPAANNSTAVPAVIDDSWPEKLPSNDIADRLGLDRELVRGRLRRYAKKYPHCRVSVGDGDRLRNESGWFYRVSSELLAAARKSN